MKDYWGNISQRFDEWTSPLRPSHEDIDIFRNAIKDSSRTLLLGVTPELQPLASIAVDNNRKAIEVHGSNSILGDWRDLPYHSEFDVIIGDGSLNVIQGDPIVLFRQAQKALKPNGRLVLRVFISPNPKEIPSDVLFKKNDMSFHAFKWRVAQALANPFVRVQELYDLIKPVYDHSTLEIYHGSDLSYYFPQLSDLPNWDKIVFPSTYELAERCPIITWHSKDLTF